MQVRRVECFSEATVDFFHQTSRLFSLYRILLEAGQTHRGTKLQGPRFLPTGDFKCLMKQTLRLQDINLRINTKGLYPVRCR